MKIKMIKTAPGHDVNANGITQPAKVYEAEKEYDVNELLGKSFIAQKLAEAVSAKKPVPENKGGKGAPENKGDDKE